jgi:uncharacterized membrane protein
MSMLEENHRQRLLRRTGVIVLVAGLIIAAFIYGNAADVDDAADSLTKRDLYQLEKLGGQEYVITSELNSFLASLWHGRRLAGTIFVISAAVSGLFFFSARRLPEPND